MAPLKTLLLIKPGSIGDIILALPCAAALKQFLPDTKITWLVDKRWESLLTDNPVIDATITFPREKFRGVTGMLRSVPWLFRLREMLRPDVALDLQGLLRSALMGRFSRARRSIGLADAREGARWFYDEITPVYRGEHSVRRYLRTLETLGLPRVTDPVFRLPSGTPFDASFESGAFILFHPFARGEAKSLRHEHVVEFCRVVEPVTVVLIGLGDLRQELPTNTINLLNLTTIRQIIWLIGAATFVVSVDSGPMHIAAAMKARMLSIHTWSDPRSVGPFSEEAWIWQGGEIRRQQLLAPSLPEVRSPENHDIRQIARFAKHIVQEGNAPS